MLGGVVELLSDEVHLWSLAVNGFESIELIDHFRDELSQEESLRCVKLADHRTRNYCVLSRVFVRWILSHYALHPLEKWTFATGQFGRPFIDWPYPAEACGLDFNVSHTQGIIAVCVGRDLKLGVDVENIRSTLLFEDLHHSFTPMEREHILSLTQEEQAMRILEFWTLKECFAKCVGFGLQIDFATIGVNFKAEGVDLSGVEPFLDINERCFFWKIQPSNHHVMAVCVASRREMRRIVRRDISLYI